MTSTPSPFTFRTVDELTLRAEPWAAPPFDAVFSPGNGFPVGVYPRAFASVLAEGSVVGLNPRGFGGSDPPSEFTGWDAPLADLRRFIEETMTPPVIAAGHSFGALLSLRLAAETPGLVRGLLLIDPLVPWRRGEPEPEGGSERERELISRTRTRRAQWPNKESAARSLRGKGVYENWADGCMDDFLETAFEAAPNGGIRLACPPWLETRIYETRPGPEVWDWAAAAGVPAAFVYGRESPVVNPTALREMADCFPMATIMEVKGGHCLAQEHLAEADAALLEGWRFLQRTAHEGETTL